MSIFLRFFYSNMSVFLNCFPIYQITITFYVKNNASSSNTSTKLIISSEYNTSNSTYESGVRIVRFGLAVGFSKRFIPKGSYLPTVLPDRSLFDSQRIILELIRDSDDMTKSTCCSISQNRFTLVFLGPVVSKTKFTLANRVFLEPIVSKHNLC